MRKLTEIESIRFKQALIAKRSSQIREASFLGYSREHFTMMINRRVPVPNENVLRYIKSVISDHFKLAA